MSLGMVLPLVLAVVVWLMAPYAVGPPVWVSVPLAVLTALVAMASHWRQAGARLHPSIWVVSVLLALLLPSRAGLWPAGSILLWGLVGDPHGPCEPWASVLGGGAVVAVYAAGIAALSRLALFLRRGGDRRGGEAA